MRSIPVVTISLVGVIALLDVAASFAINGSVDVPFLLILVVAVAVIVQGLTGSQPDDPRDDVTLFRLHLHLEALARHTAVLRARYPFAEATGRPQEDLDFPNSRLLN